MKHILANYTLRLTNAQQKMVRAMFDANKEIGEPSLMGAFQPISQLGILKVAIISSKLGQKMNKIIEAHK